MAYASFYEPSDNDERSVCARVVELVALNRDRHVERLKIRDVMNNRLAMAALLGAKAVPADLRMPMANLVLRADETLGRKIGRRPDVKVDPPAQTDQKTALERADKRARIFDTFDEVCRLEELLPQVGRWLPAYGFAAAVMSHTYVPDEHGRKTVPFPTFELRDPLQTFPGEWGAGQSPRDMAVVWRLSRRLLAAQYPKHAARILRPDRERTAGGAIILGTGMRGGWASQNGGEVEVSEYYDERGRWMTLHDDGLLLDFTPNLLSEPGFEAVKRFSPDEVTGAFDHALGVMAMQARLQLLEATAVEDSVMSELVISGDLPGGQWNRGRNGINVLPQGTTAQRMNSNVPFQAFNQLQLLERQVRVATGHSAQDDGEGGSGWTTGKGLEALASSTGLEVAEYQMSMKWWLQRLDAKRGEYDEKLCDVSKEMRGVRSGAPFAEKYRPSVDLKGDYRTRRVYGAMSGLDDQEKIVGGLQLLAAEIIDADTMREQIDGLDDHEKIKGRITATKARNTILEGMLARAQQGDPSAEEDAAKLLPDGDPMRVMVEARAKAAAAAAAQQQAAGPVAAGQGPPPDLKSIMGPNFADANQTVLSRATLDGVDAGSQVVAGV